MRVILISLALYFIANRGLSQTTNSCINNECNCKLITQNNQKSCSGSAEILLDKMPLVLYNDDIVPKYLSINVSCSKPINKISAASVYEFCSEDRIDLEFLDDGLNGDEMAGDGIYTSDIAFCQAGKTRGSSEFRGNRPFVKALISYEDGSQQSFNLSWFTYVINPELLSIDTSLIIHTVEDSIQYSKHIVNFITDRKRFGGFDYDRDIIYNKIKELWKFGSKLKPYFISTYSTDVNSGAAGFHWSEGYFFAEGSSISFSTLDHEINHHWVSIYEFPLTRGHWGYIERETTGFGNGCYAGVFNNIFEENGTIHFEYEISIDDRRFYNDIELYMMGLTDIDAVSFPIKYVKNGTNCSGGIRGTIEGEISSFSKTDFIEHTKDFDFYDMSDSLPIKFIIPSHIKLTRLEHSFLDYYVREYESHFRRATRDLGNLNTSFPYLDIDMDLDGFTQNTDCDDNNPNVYPGATEIPDNGIDEDCDGIDAISIVDIDGDGYFSDVDCNDNNANINPGATEVCNGIDENCNGQIDEGLALVRYYQDNDGDGYGNSFISITDCGQPAGYVAASGDCDDNNAGINPGATEIAGNGIDENCDGVDPPAIVDADGDGYFSDIDCNDNDSSINPGASEVCNGIDENCNGQIDEGLTILRYYQDADGDGYGNISISESNCQQPIGYVSRPGDCDDGNSSINPGQSEVPYNGIDEDCNPESLDDDLDEDGFLLADDCNDTDPNINSGQSELCDEIDNDCDGEVDEGLAINTYYTDSDDDGYGDVSTVIESCETNLIGYVTNGDDCDDTNSDINPDATEIVNNGIDEDCDGMDLTSATHELGEITLSIYPNPAVDRINIDVDGQMNYKATIYDLEGKLISESNNRTTIDITTLSQGTYLLKILDIDSGQKVVERIVIMN